VRDQIPACGPEEAKKGEKRGDEGGDPMRTIGLEGGNAVVNYERGRNHAFSRVASREKGS